MTDSRPHNPAAPLKSSVRRAIARAFMFSSTSFASYASSATFFRLLGLIIAMALVVPSALAQENPRARALGQKLMCVCGCNQVLISCNHVGCSYSHDMIKQLDERVARNEPDDLTIQAFVQEYGPTVLSAPPAKGFNRAAWIMPVVVPLIALGIFWEVIRRWRQRSALVAASSPKISPDLLARAQREAQKDADE
jgi:cytochrome c-type biogenesis protein CcmH